LQLSHARAGGGLIVLPSSFLGVHRGSSHCHSATGFPRFTHSNKFYCASRGLLCYGNEPSDSYRQAGVYIDRILRGAKPADLPQAPVKFELVINLKTAKSLDLDVPLFLQQRADELIE
jgi:putative ABC transport system substrate-binding protein